MGSHSSPPPAADRFKFLDRKKLHKGIILGADYLARACEENGRFTYRLNLDQRAAFKQKYNLLRHAGAIYALAAAYKYHEIGEICHKATRVGFNGQGIGMVGGERRRILKAISRASSYLIDSIGPLKKRKKPTESKKTSSERDKSRIFPLAVWSDPVQNGSENPRQVKLGGVALALIALSQCWSIKEVNVNISRKTLRSLGLFIRFMQKNDGSFYSKYWPRRGGCSGRCGRDDSWTSLYYPGEAALGMLMLYEIDPRKEWWDSARDALVFLAKSRQDQDQIPSDNWAVVATAKILQMASSSSISSSLSSCKASTRNTASLDAATFELLYLHAQRIAAGNLADQVTSIDTTKSGKNKEEDVRGVKIESKRQNVTHLRDEGGGGLMGSMEHRKLFIGSFRAAGKTCQAATRLEGLTAFCSVMTMAPPSSLSSSLSSSSSSSLSKTLTAPLLKREMVARGIRGGINFLLDAQEILSTFGSSLYKGGIARSGVLLLTKDSWKTTPEPTRDTEIRIDYVQHALSAFLQAQMLKLK